MKNFDLFVGIDWSGAKTPVKNKSIALAECRKGDAAPELMTGPWSRTRIADYLTDKVQELDKLNQRGLVGIDCNFGYAEQIGVEQFGDEYDYNDLWSAVDACNQNTPNYFAQGFWSHTKYSRYFWTEGKQPADFMMPRRITEKACGESGLGWPESPFKLIGARQVGKGGLAGMRMIYDLKKRLGYDLCVWPFEKEHSDQSKIIISEIFPRQFIRRAGGGSKKLRTAEELSDALTILGSKPYFKDIQNMDDHDTDAIITAAGMRFICGTRKEVPNEVANPPQMTENAAKREGWIFGVGFKG